MTRYQMVAISVCLALNMLDGFDVLVMAFTASSVASEWGLDGAQLGILLSAGLFGMAGGSVFVAPQADKYGRRTLVLVCLTIISVGMLLSAWSTSFYQLAVLRVITGMGIGGMLASLNVVVFEYSSDKWRNFFVSFLQTGYPIGAVIGGSIAAYLIGVSGWRSVFLFGALASFLMLPLVYYRLPESLEFLAAKRPPGALKKINHLLTQIGQPELDELPAVSTNKFVQKVGFRALLSPEIARSTLLTWAGFFCVMFSFYFVLSWTPKLLVASGFSAKEGISAGVILNLGGIIGGLTMGYISSKIKLERLLAVYMVLTTIFMVVFGLYPGSLAVSLVLGVLIGLFLFGSMIGLYALVPRLYPASIRTTGMGWAIGIGRIGAILSPLIGGLMLDHGWQPGSLFVVFAVPFVLSMIAVSMIRPYQS